MSVCRRCLGVDGNHNIIQVRPDQMGWLRQKHLERDTTVQTYELPTGNLCSIPRPFMLRVQCPNKKIQPKSARSIIDDAYNRLPKGPSEGV